MQVKKITLSVSARSLLIAAVAVFYFAGCSSSTSSMRYTDKKEKDKPGFADRYKDTSAVRVTDKNSKQVSDSLSEQEDEAAPAVSPKYDLASAFAKTSKSLQNGIGANFANAIESMKMAIVKYDATPYQYGGNDLDGIDCSAFTQNVYQQAFQYPIPRSAREQYQVGDVIDARTDLKFGDLVFFNTRRRVRPGHVGIYLGDNKFVHASSRSGVIISSLEEDYYNRKYMGARRMMDLENYQAAN